MSKHKKTEISLQTLLSFKIKRLFKLQSYSLKI